MALQDILEQIKKETQEKLDSLKHEHDKAVKAIDAEFDAKKEDAKKMINEKVSTNRQKILDKMRTHAKMESKNKLLREKRAILDKIFEDALAALVDSPNYKTLLTTLLKKSDIKGDDIMVIPASGKEHETKAALTDSGKNFKLAEKSAHIKGGFILQSEKIEIDNSFESILFKQLRSDLELEVAKNIFSA